MAHKTIALTTELRELDHQARRAKLLCSMMHTIVTSQVKKISGAWFRSRDFWVLSPTRSELSDIEIG